MRGALFAVLAFCAFATWAAAPGPALSEGKSLDVVGLRSIAGWLRKNGTDGYVGADVADALGIPRADGKEMLDAKQRGFRNESVLRIAQFFGDHVLFMVQGGDGEVYFYLSSLSGGLRKALVSIPGRSMVAPLEAREAESNFRAEVLYWEDKAATR
jgi:hypothetical protein